MNPRRVTATNYRTFEQLDVEIPTGCIAVIGQNGAGKSSIINAIDVALFAGRGELAPLLTTGEEALDISLEFEHANELYRVRRSFKKGKSTLDLEIRHVDLGPTEREVWEPLTRETAETTQKHLEEILGLSRATFRASSFLAQGDGAAFTEASPRDRKAILADILGLDVYDRLLDKARVELRGCEDELTRSSTLIAGCEETVATKLVAGIAHRQTVERAEEAAGFLAQAERELEQAQAELTNAAAGVERVRAAQAEQVAAVKAWEQLRTEFGIATAAGGELGDLQIELAELAADAGRIAELDARVTELRAAAAAADETSRRQQEIVRHKWEREQARGKMVERGQQLHADAAALRAKADHLDVHIGESARCDRCQQVLGAEAAKRAAESYRAEAVGLDQQSVAIDETCERELQFIAELVEQLEAIEISDVADPAPVELQLAAARRAGEEHVRVTERVRQLTQIAARRDEIGLALDVAKTDAEAKQAALDVAKQDAGDVTVVEAKVGRWRVSVQESRTILDARKADVTRGEQLLERIAGAERQLAEHRLAVETISSQVDVLKLAEKAFGRDGIPALIVENAAIPQIEVEANRILAELGGATADCRIELRTQRELKSSAELRETLDIVIRTTVGDRPYETFSGGERTRLNLALRIALARLLAHRRGAESRLLAIDEPEFLDEAGVGRLADVLRGLAGDFDRILLVSHHPTLAASFDQTIAVSKDRDRSHVDGGVLEAVAA